MKGYRKKKNDSIQEIILSLLMGKKTYNKDTLVEHIILQIPNREERKVNPKYLINRKIKKMQEDGLIKQYETNFSLFISITDEGKKRFYQKKILSEETILPRSWDNLWRIVIIDIDNRDKEKQDSIRYILKKAHFVQLKASIWVSPFPIEEFIHEMKKNLGLSEEIIVIIGESFDTFSGEALMKKFLEGMRK